ncbi:MAG: ROK family transcriptional regulator [Candidatus Omnitrophica bacterium]|nr:ROK family transcriptional regulator [Candidatus Omnitrophota bacterium]
MREPVLEQRQEGRGSTIRRRALLEEYRLTEREQKSLSLLELIRQRGPLTRTELSQGTGLNIVTVSNYVADFIEQGLVGERGFDVSTGGRKPVLVELNAKAGFAIGIDLGPLDFPQIMMRGVITDLRGTIVHRMVNVRSSENMDQVLLKAGELTRQLIASSLVDPQHIQGVAIGVGGILDERAGTVRDTSHRGIRTSYLALRDRWEDEFKMPVLIGNDASLAGYGEYRLGLDRPVDNMVYLYSDVGASLIFHGQLFWGSGGGAGELGVFMPSSDDYLAWVKSPGFVVSNVWDLGLTAQARKLIEEGHATTIADRLNGGLESITMDRVIQSAQQGDKLARELIEHSALQLGIRIASLVNLLNPEVVVIGGGVEKAGALLLEPVWRAVKRYAYEESANLVDVLPAKLGEDAVALGAACWVIREIFVQA